MITWPAIVAVVEEASPDASSASANTTPAAGPSSGIEGPVRGLERVSASTPPVNAVAAMIRMAEFTRNAPFSATNESTFAIR